MSKFRPLPAPNTSDSPPTQVLDKFGIHCGFSYCFVYAPHVQCPCKQTIGLTTRMSWCKMSKKQCIYLKISIFEHFAL